MYLEAQYPLLELRELHKFLVQTKDHVAKTRQKRNFDSHHEAQTLPYLMPEDVVWLPDWQTEGVIQGGTSVISSGITRRFRNCKDIIELPSSEEVNPQMKVNNLEVSQPLN